MTVIFFLCLGAIFLAYTNGANDNFKGVATLYSCNAASYRRALGLASVATLAGSISSVFLASALIKVFSGAGVVPVDVAGSSAFVIAVACGAAWTVAIATLLGMPVSTTHGLTGAIAGAGFMAVGNNLHLSVLGQSFLAPLLLSPVIAIVLVRVLYGIVHWLSLRTGISRRTCVCVGETRVVAARRLQLNPGDGSYALAWIGDGDTPITIATERECVEKYSGRFAGMSVQPVVDMLHHLSAAAVCFARGLNDTPKIVALLLTVKLLDIRLGTILIAAAMVAGGVINARRVAETMSKKISRMNDGQALTANIVTAFLVIFASKLGLPVSTTHVSVGAISGVGLANGTASTGVISTILISWLLTLPIAAAIGAASYALLSVIH